jgi:hypothetical protein
MLLVRAVSLLRLTSNRILRVLAKFTLLLVSMETRIRNIGRAFRIIEIAWVVPNRQGATRKHLDDYWVSVDEIERVTGEPPLLIINRRLPG